MESCFPQTGILSETSDRNPEVPREGRGGPATIATSWDPLTHRGYTRPVRGPRRGGVVGTLDGAKKFRTHLGRFASVLR